MDINQDNYLSFFLDFHEGRLSQEEKGEVLQFTRSHPGLEKELREYHSLCLPASENTPAADFSFLHKQHYYGEPGLLSAETLDEWLIADLEGQLSPEQKQQWGSYIKDHPEAGRQKSLYAKTILNAEAEIVFADKNRLYCKPLPADGIVPKDAEWLMARDLEGDLDQGEQLKLHQYLQANPEAIKAKELYSKTRLKADPSIVFSGKKHLKKSISGLRTFVIVSLSAAAALLLFVGVRQILITSGPETATQNRHFVVAGPTPSKRTQTKQPESTNLPVTEQMVKPSGIQARPHRPMGDMPQNIAQVPQAPLALMEARRLRPVLQDPAELSKKFVRQANERIQYDYDLYASIKLAEELDRAEQAYNDSQNDAGENKSMFAKTLEVLSWIRMAPDAETGRISKWGVAEIGVKTYNMFTDKKLELNLEKDANGKVVSYAFESAYVDVERNSKAADKK